MSSIEVVSHVYNSKEVPIYGKLAQLQFSSLLLNPPSIDTIITICYSPEDQGVVEVIDWFQYEKRNIPTLSLNKVPLSEEKLFRRAIGRNLVAKKSLADVIWFCDIDYLFNNISTLQLAHYHCLKSDKNIVYPEVVNTNVSHTFGDTYVDMLKGGKSFRAIQVDPNHFYPKNYRKAIGGIQIVKGSYAREHGYLDGTKWVKPVDASKGFRSCKGDPPFRRAAGGSEGVDIVGVFRIRHSFCGRDGGTKNHGNGKVTNK